MRFFKQSFQLTGTPPVGSKRPASDVFGDDEARQRLAESTSREETIPSHLDPGDYADTLVCIQEAAKINGVTFDLSKCAPLSLTLLGNRVASALLDVVNRSGMKLRLPCGLQSIPGWLLRCDRIEEVDIPEFEGDKIDLRDWTQ